MNINFPYKVVIRFPGDLEYIPAVRKFVSELMLVSSFSQKFAYRSEIIVDEICNNAVSYGSQGESAQVELICEIYEDRIEFTINDQGGAQAHLERLQSTMRNVGLKSTEEIKTGLGLEIVRMLSESMDVVVDKKNITSVHVVRKRESA